MRKQRKENYVVILSSELLKAVGYGFFHPLDSHQSSHIVFQRSFVEIQFVMPEVIYQIVNNQIICIPHTPIAIPCEDGIEHLVSWKEANF
jgi:hypothetical protein